MTARLDLDSKPDGYVISWWDDDDDMVQGDLCIGEKIHTITERADEEHNFVTERLREICPPDYIHDEVFHWESITLSRKALKIAHSLQKQFKSSIPWPEWAIKAQAEGWKPPKGWKP